MSDGGQHNLPEMVSEYGTNEDVVDQEFIFDSNEELADTFANSDVTFVKNGEEEDNSVLNVNLDNQIEQIG